MLCKRWYRDDFSLGTRVGQRDMTTRCLVANYFRVGLFCILQSAAFAAWEDALEKLKALDYEASFCKTNNVQPFSRCVRGQIICRRRNRCCDKSVLLLTCWPFFMTWIPRTAAVQRGIYYHHARTPSLEGTGQFQLPADTTLFKLPAWIYSCSTYTIS